MQCHKKCYWRDFFNIPVKKINEFILMNVNKTDNLSIIDICLQLPETHLPPIKNRIWIVS